MKQKMRRFFLFIAFAILILIFLSVDEVHGKKKRRHPPRREGKITRNEEQIERTKRRKAPKAKGMGSMRNETHTGDEPGTTTSSSSTTRTEPRMEESIDPGNRKVTVDEQRVEKKASRQEKQVMRNKQYMRRTTESASSTTTNDDIVTTSSTSSESPKMPDERKEDPGRSLRDPPGVEVHRADEEDYGRTLAPGIEPSPPGFANEEEYARHRATLATTTTTMTGATLVENIFAADIEGPRPIVSGQNDMENDIFLVVTPATIPKTGIDSNRFWKFTRVPYIHNNSRIVKESEQMEEQREKKNRKEEQHPAGENEQNNLRRGQNEIFMAKNKENAGGEKKPDTEATRENCTKRIMETYTERTTVPENEKTEIMQDSTAVITIINTTATKDSEFEITEMIPERTTTAGNLFISLLPDTAAQFDFDLDPSGNKAVDSEKDDEQIKIGAQREPEKKNLEVVEEATTVEVSESETTQTMPLGPQGKDKIEGDCCALLRLLVGQKLNTTVGEPTEFFAGTEEGTHPQADEANKAETGGVANNKLVEHVEDEDRKDEETPSNSTVRAQWKIIESGKTMKNGLEILSEDLREENVKLIRNHPESNEPTPVTELSTTVKSTPPETVTHYRGQKGGQFPRSTTTLASTHKWTPYIFNCALESDERGERLCQEWAKGGLCEINRATQFLFCRRTCLCIGIQDETPSTRR